MAPDPNRRRRLCTTLASLRNVRSAISSTRSNFGGFILNKDSKGTLRIYIDNGLSFLSLNESE